MSAQLPVRDSHFALPRVPRRCRTISSLITASTCATSPNHRPGDAIERTEQRGGGGGGRIVTSLSYNRSEEGKAPRARVLEDNKVLPLLPPRPAPPTAACARRNREMERKQGVERHWPGGISFMAGWLCRRMCRTRSRGPAGRWPDSKADRARLPRAEAPRSGVHHSQDYSVHFVKVFCKSTGSDKFYQACELSFRKLK